LSWKVISTSDWLVVSLPMKPNAGCPFGIGVDVVLGMSLTTEKVEELFVKVTSLAGTWGPPNTKGVSSVHSTVLKIVVILYGNVTVQWSGDVFMTLIPVIDPLSVTVRVEDETSVICKSCGVGAGPAKVDWLTSAALITIGKGKMIFVFIRIGG